MNETINPRSDLYVYNWEHDTIGFMNIARQIAKYEDKGFTRERAEVNALMEHAGRNDFQRLPRSVCPLRRCHARLVPRQREAFSRS